MRAHHLAASSVVQQCWGVSRYAAPPHAHAVDKSKLGGTLTRMPAVQITARNRQAGRMSAALIDEVQ